MPSDFQVDAAQLFQHSAKVRAIGDRINAIRSASSSISQDDEAYGRLCGWMAAILEQRHAGQDQLYTYVQENLRLLAEALDATGRDYDAVDDDVQRRIRAAGGSSRP